MEEIKLKSQELFKECIKPNPNKEKIESLLDQKGIILPFFPFQKKKKRIYNQKIKHFLAIHSNPLFYSFI